MAEDLKSAIEKGDLEAVSALLEKGISVNEMLESEFTPLITATNSGHFDIVKKLIESGADVNAKRKVTKNLLTPHQQLQKVQSY